MWKLKGPKNFLNFSLDVWKDCLESTRMTITEYDEIEFSCSSWQDWAFWGAIVMQTWFYWFGSEEGTWSTFTTQEEDESSCFKEKYIVEGLNSSEYTRH